MTAVAHRIHVGGDVCRPDGSLDRSYVAALLSAYRRARQRGASPRGWMYSHAWRLLTRHRAFLERVGIRVFASVHTEGQRHDAIRLGFRVARALALRKNDVKKMLVVPTHAWNEDGTRGLICPEQTGRVEDCGACGACLHLTEVHFLEH